LTTVTAFSTVSRRKLQKVLNAAAARRRWQVSTHHVSSAWRALLAAMQYVSGYCFRLPLLLSTTSAVGPCLLQRCLHAGRWHT